MNVATIDLTTALTLRDQGALLVDVRAPAEFADTTIPGAVNIPIFTDAERAEVGTVYKQQGKAEARQLGVELVAPKIPQMVAAAQKAAEGRKGPIIVFCWRGGMRSRAMTAFFDLAGLPSRQLEGGHKAFRRRVLDDFEQGIWKRVLVLRGMTGVGKTLMLEQLAGDGYPVIDLEGLANHRGSAFGNLGLPPQPGQKQFEALLWEELRRLQSSDYILVEGESRHIGRVLVPPKLFADMQTETSLWLDAPLELRIRYILDDYPAIDAQREAFVRPITALKERLGNDKVAELLELLEQGAWQELTRELMVNYYDPLYEHTRPERRIEIDASDLAQGLERTKQAVATLLAEPPAAGAQP